MKTQIIKELILVLCCLCCFPIYSSGRDHQVTDIFQWGKLPDLPDPLGVAGPFAGISNDVLLVAGGANFPVSLFDGGKKVWTEKGYVLQKQSSGRYRWINTFVLDRPIAYGASVNVPRSVVFIGGCDAEQCYDEVVRIEWTGDRVQQYPWPQLPQPCGFTSAALIGTTIYVAGGQSAVNPQEALKNFWALDLTDIESGWKVLEPWPGPARALPVAAAQDGCFYVFSGHDYVPGENGAVVRKFLNDAYRYDPITKQWTRIADLPVSVAAGAAPGFPAGSTHILIFGGNDGSLAGREMELKDNHHGFSQNILAYHTVTDTWRIIGKMPAGHVTTNAIQWGEGVVITSGEIRPGVRSPELYLGTPVETKTGFALLDYGVLFVYLILLVGIGIYFSRSERTTEDFFLARHRIPWWAAGMSIFGTQLSAITFMSIPAKSYLTDWTFFIFNLGIFTIAPLVVFFFLPFFSRLNVTSAYEYLELRFNSAVRMLGSASFVLVQLGRMGIVLYLPAIALTTVTGINIYFCIALMGVLCTIYTVLGGIQAVIWTDVVQVIVLIGGVIISLVLIALNVDGGLQGIIQTGFVQNKFKTFDWNFSFGSPTIWVIVIAWFGNLIPYASDQTVIQRYMTTASEKEAARSIWTNAFLTIPASILFFGVGTALYVFYKSKPDLLNPVLSTDAIFPWFIAHELPAGISGLVIAGIFAAAMSSLDSSLNSTATALVTDFYRRIKREASDHTCLNLARLLTVIFGVIATGTALIMAKMDITSLWDVFIKIIGLFGGGLAGLFVLGIFTRKAHGTGALVGFVVSIIVQILVQFTGSIHFLLYGVTGIVSCFTAGYLASIVIPVAVNPANNLTIFTLTKVKQQL
ncbi:MAG: sodium/solute symporter [Candidatus Latescibacteria bacterium]|nr:sodium/solute symporter [Candidatus Latescibacterota bacterium]